MGRDLNFVMIEGRLGRDPEMRYTPNGQANTQFSVATSRSRKVNEEWQEETTWFRVTLWAQSAERAAEALRKSMVVRVIGRIRTFDYEKDGVKTFGWEVIGDRFDVLDRGVASNDQPRADQSGQGRPNGERPTYDQPRPVSTPPSAIDLPEFVDDLPF